MRHHDSTLGQRMKVQLIHRGEHSSSSPTRTRMRSCATHDRRARVCADFHKLLRDCVSVPLFIVCLFGAQPVSAQAGSVQAATAQSANALEYRAIPGVRINAGSTGAGAEIGHISAVAQLTNGSIVIGDDANGVLHMYSAGGRRIRTVGRNGAGPGEFKSIRWVGECGRDTLYVYDSMQSRISVFEANGTLVRSFSPPLPRVAYVRCAADGTMAYVAASGMSGLASRGVVQVMDRAGMLLYRSPDLLLDDGQPLGRSMKISAVSGNVAYGNGDDAVVTIVPLTGKMVSPNALRRVTAGSARHAPSAANRDASLEYWATYLPGTQADYEQLRQFLRKLPAVKTVPAYSDVFVDAVTNVLWTQTSVLGDGATVLARTALDGTAQGRAILPPNLIVQQIRGDVVVAKVANAGTGVESVVVYRLVPSRR